MGCDIHGGVEVKVNGQWQFRSELPGDRDYQLFAKMGNVRNYGDKILPLSDERGVPEDTCPELRKDYEEWDVDAHSASYLAGPEMLEVERWYREREGEWITTKDRLFPERVLWGRDFSPGEVQAIVDGLRDGIEDIRAVFWFDN